MKIIKKVKNCELIPPFYAPYVYCYSENAVKCTYIGLNILFYFFVELKYAFEDCARMSARRHNDKVDGRL